MANSPTKKNCPFCGRFMKWQYDRWICFFRDDDGDLGQHCVIDY